LQVPIDISYDWLSGRVEVRARDLAGRLAGGRVSGRAELTGSTRSGLRAEVDAKFDGGGMSPRWPVRSTTSPAARSSRAG
jgi:hypothetical protein